MVIRRTGGIGKRLVRFSFALIAVKRPFTLGFLDESNLRRIECFPSSRQITELQCGFKRFEHPFLLQGKRCSRFSPRPKCMCCGDSAGLRLDLSYQCLIATLCWTAISRTLPKQPLTLFGRMASLAACLVALRATTMG